MGETEQRGIDNRAPCGEVVATVVAKCERRSPGSTPKALGPFFAFAARAPRIASGMCPLIAPLVGMVAPGVRASTRLNARRIFSRELSGREQREFTRKVVSSFYSFITDLALVSRRAGDVGLADDLIGNVYGEEEYLAARSRRRGAVLVTAHFGSFEAGLFALRRVEPVVHVVFKRDETVEFERMRSALRRSLGVREAPIDDGLGTWLGLRDALLRDEVVVLQGDRAVAGQQSAVVPFLGGSLRIPTGPVRLAALTGSPIVPVFAIRRADGRHDIHLAAPIEPTQPTRTGSSAALCAVAKSIEQVVAKHPDQWLMLDAAFEEDHRG